LENHKKISIMKKYRMLLLTLALLTGSIKVAANTTVASNNTHVPNSVSIDQSKAVGEIPFTSGVSASGAMTYTVPIAVYPGIRGFQPQLSLTYNHFAGNSVVGTGWNIGGLSMIARTTKNTYYDNMTQGVAMDKNDMQIRNYNPSHVPTFLSTRKESECFIADRLFGIRKFAESIEILLRGRK
jgi:hypothetical protein